MRTYDKSQELAMLLEWMELKIQRRQPI